MSPPPPRSSSRTVDYVSHGDARPVATMVNTWLFCIMMPAAVLAWSSTKQWTAVLGAMLATPALAILQGALGILSFRIYFGDAPVPRIPAHGVVMVRPDNYDDDDDINNQTSLQEILEEQPPIRLLVIGDSLAIGVGQSHSPTPIMPEVIAKTLSKRLGRVVYWTCHGAPGASTGWIVRELERGIDYLNDNDDSEVYIPTHQRKVSLSDTDESSSDEDSDSTSFTNAAASSSLMQSESSTVWRDRLALHRKRFNPDSLGPYDIVVVLTGSNDLKSAFFPFLLTGEDAEFRRQARERGGSYSKELRLLLETLYSRMRLRIQTIRASVEAATESVREKVEETMEMIAPGTRTRLQLRRKTNSSKRIDETAGSASTMPPDQSRHFPLVVLPAMPARALPIFRRIPLRWLSVPIVDIMDMHKRNLAKSHPGDVLFVEAPSVEDLALYENELGEIWHERCEEETLLNLRDIRPRNRQRIEDEMRRYYEPKTARQNRIWFPFLSRLSQPPGARAFSIDQIHPNDQGYDFWGRYIARAIMDEWQTKQHL